MKRLCSISTVFLVLPLVVLLLFGCAPVSAQPSETPAAAPTLTASPVSKTEPAQATAVPTTPVESAALPSTPAAAIVTPAPSITAENPKMYSSYADLVSFDPATGVAQFDYFDLLRGDDAVNYLVSHEGYTQADAQALVDQFADSEFVKKNENPQLRAVDLDDVSLKLMIQPSGEPVDGAESIPANANDARAIYAIDPSLLSMYFYSIHVEDDGHVSLVEQVYWP